MLQVSLDEFESFNVCNNKLNHISDFSVLFYPSYELYELNQ